MGKFGDKFLNIFGLDDDDDDYDDYDDDYEDDYDDISEKKSKSFFSRKSKEEKDFDDFDDFDEPAPKPSKSTFEKSKPISKPASKVVPMRSSRANGMEVCVIKPTSIEDSREITDTLLSGRAVILNLEGLHLEVAQRIIDFCSGSCYSIDGNLQKISNYIFIVTPATVDISGDFQELLGGSSSGGFDIPL
ncbi:MAG: cell division protein SepF [Parasporobacterium sp.]|nr:cell division protein SepF [Parasporobacterium sp.]